MSYKIVEQIKENTFTAAKDGRFFILKRINEEDAAVFRRLGAINSPNLASVREVVLLDEGLYAVTDYIPGDTLESILCQNGPLSEDDSVRYILGILGGLTKLHEQGLVHRDINPSNIIITREGTAVIIDYGISRVFKEGKGSDTTVLGTAGYTAPEQFGFIQTDARSDIYSAGVLFSRMLTGALPTEIPPTGRFAAVVEKCMAFNPDERYPSVQALAEDISWIYDGRRSRKPYAASTLRRFIVLSVIVSILFIYGGTMIAIFADNTVSIPAAYAVFATLAMFLPPFFICNFYNWQDRLPFFSHISRRKMRIRYIVIGFLLMLTATIILVAAQQMVG